MKRSARVIALAVALVLVALLATARWLTPDARGFGTHTQLGLADCFFVRQWGIRCPTCGTTTAWAHLMRGSLNGAVAANPAGTLAGLAAMAAAPWLLASGLVGRWCYCRPGASLLFPFLAVLLLVLLLDWIRHTGLSLAWARFLVGG